jgi:hypothetical protein
MRERFATSQMAEGQRFGVGSLRAAVSPEVQRINTFTDGLIKKIMSNHLDSLGVAYDPRNPGPTFSHVSLMAEIDVIAKPLIDSCPAEDAGRKDNDVKNRN